MGLFGVGNQVPTIFGGRNAIFGGRPVAAAPAGVVSEWCLAFNGNNYVTCGDRFNFDHRSQPCTISAWVKTSDETAKVVVAKVNTFGMLGYGLYVNANGSGNSSGSVYFGTASNATVIGVKSTTSTNVNDGEWHHLACTIDGSGTASGVTLYLDGSQLDKSIVSDNLAYSTSNSYPFQVGARDGTGLAIVGRIDDVRIYNRALDSTEVAALAANTANITTGMTARIAMEEGTGTSTEITDGTGLPIGNATLAGGPAWSTDVPAWLAP